MVSIVDQAHAGEVERLVAERDEARGRAENLAIALSVEIERPEPRLPWRDDTETST